VGDEFRTVGAVSRLAGVSVRTLHHYHRAGLLRPSGRSAAGYRLYSLGDLKRLQQILFYRTLGFALDEISQILASPGDDADAHLRRQHRLLRERIARQQDMLAAIEKEMEARKMGISLTPEEQFEVFGTDKVSGEWAAEAERRWGDTEAWRQSQRRAATYTKQDWLEIRDETFAINQAFLAAMSDGEPAGGQRAMDVAERHRQHISRWFYDCPPEMHAGLGRMYVEDERFTAHYEEVAPGLAQFVSTAVQANAARRSA
jgi:MerR family transcriptional regulator, thiopeptide resistance regulator